MGIVAKQATALRFENFICSSPTKVVAITRPFVALMLADGHEGSLGLPIEYHSGDCHRPRRNTQVVTSRLIFIRDSRRGPLQVIRGHYRLASECALHSENGHRALGLQKPATAAVAVRTKALTG